MPENYVVDDLVNKTSAMNQMRNTVYHLIKFMQEKNIKNSDIDRNLKRMGKNIAITMNKIFDFKNLNAEDMIKKIYRDLLESKVIITRQNNQYIIEDKNCALCKYHRQDIMISPDTIIPSMVAEILVLNGKKVIDFNVQSSKSIGDITCIHVYEIIEGGA